MSRADRVIGALIAVAWIGLAIALAATDTIPPDISAYLVGADVFWNQGLDPYLPPHFAASAHWTGYPYVYHPGTLALLYPLAVLPAWATVLAMTLLRGAATLAVCRWLVRRYALTVSWPMLALGAVMFTPWVHDAYGANLATFGLAGWAALDALCGRRRCGWALGAAALAGLLVCAKPVWLLPPLWAAVCAKRADVGAAFVAGAAVCLALSLPWEPALWTHWWDMITTIRQMWFTFDAHALGGRPLWLGLLGVWVAVGLWLWRARSAREAMTWASASVLGWPRLNVYSYLALVPMLIDLSRRLPRWALGALCAPSLVLLPILFDDLGYPRLYRIMCYPWALIVAITWLVSITRGAAPRQEAT